VAFVVVRRATRRRVATPLSRSQKYAVRVGLSTYRSCTFAEKRAVLRTFWSHHRDDSDKVIDAAREYGPYALVMVAVIALELAVISAVLFSAGNSWAWPAVTATALAAVSTWWTRVCQRASVARSA
jgi:hypothetical protein